jgi:xylulokinase
MRQLMADVFGAPVMPVSSRQGAAVGAAMQAAVAFFHGCGESLGFEEIASYWSPAMPGRAAIRTRKTTIYQEMISRQQYLVDTLHPAGFL